MYLLELQAAIRAGPLYQGRGGSAGRAGRLVGDDQRRLRLYRCEALALHGRAPVTAQQIREIGDVFLLDQEVRLGPSTFAGAGRAADDRRDAALETALAQRLHLVNRARHRGHEWKAIEQLLGLAYIHSPDHYHQRVTDPSRKISGWLQTQN